MVKILHTGDVHLDSPFTLEDPSRSQARRSELRSAFSSMMTYVKTSGTALCLIAGDLLDNEFATKETVAFLLREFAAAPECTFVISPGNHDPYTENGVYAKTLFPKNVHIFKSGEVEKLELDELGCDVYGYAFTSHFMERNPMIGVRPDDPSRINILCAHGDTASPISKYCPITERDIFDSGFDYIALGHIHNSVGIQREGDTTYAYCGCLEGRDYSESGYKGAITGTVAKNGPSAVCNLHGLRFSTRRYADERINVTGAADLSQVATAIHERIKRHNYGDDTLMRVTLEGSVPPSLPLSKQALGAMLPSLYSFDMIDRTTPSYDAEALENDLTIKGSLYRRLRPRLTEGTAEEREVASAALRYALGALEGADFIDY